MLLDKGAQLSVVVERREKIALGQIARGGVTERMKRAVKAGRQSLLQHRGRMIAAHAEQTAEMILVDMRADREVEPRKRGEILLCADAAARAVGELAVRSAAAVDERIEASVRPGRVRGVDEYRFPVAHVDEGEP